MEQKKKKSEEWRRRRRRWRIKRRRRDRKIVERSDERRSGRNENIKGWKKCSLYKKSAIKLPEHIFDTILSIPKR